MCGEKSDKKIFHLHEHLLFQFDLVCDRSWLVSFTQTILVCGMTVGSMVISPLPDQFGRKPVHLIGVFLLAMFSLATSFSYHYITFVVLRFITGVLIIVSSIF